MVLETTTLPIELLPCVLFGGLEKTRANPRTLVSQETIRDFQPFSNCFYLRRSAIPIPFRFRKLLAIAAPLILFVSGVKTAPNPSEKPRERRGAENFVSDSASKYPLQRKEISETRSL